MLNTFQSHGALGFEQPPGVRHAFLSRGFERLRVAPPWPRLLCPSAPLHWLSGLLLPSARLLNCNRLSFTQAPPFERESHAPLQGHIPHSPAPSTSATSAVRPRSAPCRAPLPHWLQFSPDPAPEAGFFSSLAGPRFGPRPLSRSLAPIVSADASWSCYRAGVAQFWGARSFSVLRDVPRPRKEF